jgi:4-carboxymuconolactone decarboxylase
MSQKSDEERYQHGLKVVDQVYGPGSNAMMTPMKGNAYVDETVNHLFGEIWSRPQLSIRDRRLLVIGATTMLGREDLIEIQVKGAILNGELTDEQLDELPLMMTFYAGAGNTTALFRGIQAAKAKVKAAQNK